MPEASPTSTDMGRDVDLALALAQGRPTGPAADEVRKRLRSHIWLLVDPAEEYAKDLADSRARDIATATVDHARGLLRDQGGDPAAMLRLLGKAVYHLMRYASQVQRHGQQQ
ncbi:DUF6415 family natural product biosynthesis protein [Streptomyces atratus]|uniref:SAV-6107-like HEPN domain-containing protein n=1 Tax=Streptomyces atratus TaxID=1893 RepID=A0A1K1WMN5_STRAR|nr:DUF6415 family natural product biosynthesis protein [Streptomyces atratus]SFX38640.1 hypothetical protein SAMN02787144_1002539 [Streptomyces atratus]